MLRASRTLRPAGLTGVGWSIGQGVDKPGGPERRRFLPCQTVIETLVVGPDDWRLWRELRLAALGDAPAAFGSTLAEWSGPGDTEPRWRGRLRDVALNLVVVLDSTPVGMVSATASGSDSQVELISLWVAPAARGRGVGDEAVRQVLDWARRQYPDGPVMLSVKVGNSHATRLYERHGFVDVGPSTDDPDERLMRRSGIAC